MQRTEIINKLIVQNNYNSYLEIGLDDAVNYSSIQCKNKESVDPYFVDSNGSNGDHIVANSDGTLLPEIAEQLTYRLTSDEFFKQNPDKRYDLIFIDGLHTKEQVSKDIINGLKLLNENGMILVHDCIPINYVAQLVPRQSQGWNGDVWKALPVLGDQGLKYKVIDDPDEYGIGVIYKSENNLELTVPDKFLLTYEEIFHNHIIKSNVLHLIHSDELWKK